MVAGHLQWTCRAAGKLSGVGDTVETMDVATSRVGGDITGRVPMIVYTTHWTKMLY